MSCESLYIGISVVVLTFNHYIFCIYMYHNLFYFTGKHWLAQSASVLYTNGVATYRYTYCKTPPSSSSVTGAWDLMNPNFCQRSTISLFPWTMITVWRRRRGRNGWPNKNRDGRINVKRIDNKQLRSWQRIELPVDLLQPKICTFTNSHVNFMIWSIATF